MLRKSISMFLCVIILVSSITCGFSVSAATAENMILTPTAPTSLRNTTAATRLTGWSRSSSGSSAVTTEDGYAVVSRTGVANGTLFTNTFTLTKNSTYKFSFEIKAVEGTSFTYTKSSTGETLPRGVNFVLNDFSVVKADGSAYNTYGEGQTDYAHTNKANYNNPTRSGFTATWSHELADGSIHTENQTRYSSWGRKIGTSEASTALKTVDLSELYSDWRTVTCEFILPNEDVYTASDIAIGFVLPAGAANGGIYVRNVQMYKQVADIADNTIATVVVDSKGNEHISAADIPVTTAAEDNGDGTYNIAITYDAMDGVNSFLGWYNGETLLSTEENYTTAKGTDLEDITAKIQCNSVITGGLGFESYKTSTSLRVEPKQSGTPPYDDRWGIWSNFAKVSGDPVGYENLDWDFDIKTTSGDTTVKYAPTYDTSASAFTVSETVIKPYSGNSMFYFAARSRSVVRKLDNLKPDTDYELSFYTYNLTKWDFLSTAVVADSYDLPSGTTSSTDTVKVYAAYKEGYENSTVVSNRVEISDTSKILDWQKITVKFTTDEDDTALYLHLACKNGNSSSSTSKQFLDNITVTEILPPETFGECTEYVGTSIRRAADGVPQAIRFKFEILNSAAKVYKDEGYELKEYGALVAYDSELNGSQLVLNDDMTANGYEVVKGVAFNEEKGINHIYETREDSIVVSFALYNIGVYGNSTDYSAYNRPFAVRPYAIYVDAEGNDLVVYDDTEKASLFDVTDKVLSASTANEVSAAYSSTSSEYASYLNDVLTVRNLLSKREVKSVYDASGRTAFKNNDNASCTIIPTDIAEGVVLHTELQAEYLADNYNNIANYADGTSELSRPLTIDFNWSATANGNGTFYGYLFTLSENSDLSDGVTYSLKSTTLNLGNFKIGTDYYWNITAIYNDGIYVSAIDKFSTDGTAPRNVYISGVTNARDIGGLVIGGKRTNQGLIFRTGRIDNATVKGQATLFDELGIKSEIDIRLESEAKNTFGDKLNYYPFYMGYSGSILTSNHESIVKFFEVLGDESNYPILYHCSIGTDRTGMMSFLLNGLLGATEEQLYRDYLFSNFGNIGSSRDNWAIGSYLGYVNKCEGNTLAERIYNYLLNIGVKAEHMDTYIRMMTE